MSFKEIVMQWPLRNLVYNNIISTLVVETSQVILGDIPCVLVQSQPTTHNMAFRNCCLQ